MNKNVKILLIIFLILILFLVSNMLFGFYIPCLFRLITHLYCPGCGITRMFLSILSLDFYQAFRYNMLLFILLPVFIFFALDYIYSIVKKKKPFYKKVPNYVWYILIVILILWMIIRNIFPYFAPTTI